MRIAILLACAVLASPAFAADPAYVKSVEDWRAKADQGLRKDNGWLTLAGRYVMKPGVNTFGTGAANSSGSTGSAVAPSTPAIHSRISLNRAHICIGSAVKRPAPVTCSPLPSRKSATSGPVDVAGAMGF